MNLETHYNILYSEAVAKIKADQCETDSLIDSPVDKRLGITLLIRPDDKTKTEICSFLSKLKEIEPSQYYYPATDMHTTVMSVISCYTSFDPSLIRVNDYVDVIEKTNGEETRCVPPYFLTFQKDNPNSMYIKMNNRHCAA